MRKYKLKTQQGFSLIEVLVFITIISLFFVTAISISVSSLRSMRKSEHKLMATHYADQVNEWLKSEKAKGWNQFYSNSQSYPCSRFNTTTITWGTDCSGTITYLDSIYDRTVTFTFQPSVPEVRAHITVNWKEASQQNSVALDADFTPWQ